MNIQVFAPDGKIFETIEEVHINLKSNYGRGVLLDKLTEIYKKKYLIYMYEKYKMDRRSGEERRLSDSKRVDSDSDRRKQED